MEIRSFFNQTLELTLASIKARYRKTWAGFLWVILHPVLLFGVQSLVFKNFLGLNVPDYYLFLLGGLLPWIFLTSTILMGTPVFVSQSPLLKSFKINPWVILCAQVLDSFLNFIMSFVLILLPFYFVSDNSILHLLVLPIALLPLLMGAFGLTVSLSVLNVFYRDINFVMGFLFNLLYYITPIFYPRSFIPEKFHILVDLNPFIYFIEPFRIIIHSSDLLGISTALLKSYAGGIIALSVAFFIWRRKQNEFYRKL